MYNLCKIKTKYNKIKEKLYPLITFLTYYHQIDTLNLNLP